MSVLDGEIVEVALLTKCDKERMFFLMDTFYEYIRWDNFIRDLEDKDYCIVLYDSHKVIQGFSTQKIVSINLLGKTIYGVFSGDTIVHKDFWKTAHPLFKIFGNFFEKYSRDYDEFYWFLICKGYKTYKILPTFFNEFYPRFDVETPKRIQEIIHAFGEIYSSDYNRETGVIEYSTLKDTLRVGVADVTAEKAKNIHTSFFIKSNPGYLQGNDLVCITALHKHNYQKGKEGYLWG